MSAVIIKGYFGLGAYGDTQADAVPTAGNPLSLPFRDSAKAGQQQQTTGPSHQQHAGAADGKDWQAAMEREWDLA